MKIETFVKRGSKLLQKYNLQKWKIVVVPYFQRQQDLKYLFGGFCSLQNKTLYFTRDVIQLNNWTIARKIFLHEAAHILSDYDDHNYKFQKIAKKIGGFHTKLLPKYVVTMRSHYRSEYKLKTFFDNQEIEEVLQNIF